MKIEQARIKKIRKQFAELQSKEDLVNLLSDAKIMLYGEKCKPIQLKSLTYYANPVLCKERYWTFTIKKKSGGERTINAPVKGLKSILRALNLVLQCMYQPHEAATGFVLEKSIVDNAKKHVGHHYVLNIDLKDFYHTFDRNRVKMAFMSEPFNLKGEKEPLAFLLASLCTHPFEIDGEVKTVLPQGSPTSPTLTNILCKKLDRRLTGLAKRFGAIYTRYADDITFSSYHSVLNKEEFQNELHRIIAQDHLFIFPEDGKIIKIGSPLEINHKKTRLQKSKYRQEVTGLIVNDKANIRKRYVKQIRMWLYYWEKYGLEKAEQIFKRDYFIDKGHVKNMNAHLINVLDGKLEFLKMVKGEKGKIYSQLRRRFDTLTGRIKTNEVEKNYPEEITTTSDLIDDTKILRKVFPIIHTPKTTVDLLKNFSANNQDLKYTTHSWEFGKFKSYDDFLIKIQRNWDEVSEELKAQNNKLQAKINNFLFNKNLGTKTENEYYINWGEKRLKFGWSSPEVKQFYDSTRNNPLICPVPDKIRNLDKEWNLLLFKDYVDVFKNEIEFREDSNNLEKLFLAKRKEILSYDFKIKLQNLKGISFYTDVAYFSKIIEIIFLESFKPRPQFPNILVNLKKEENHYLLSITQEGSSSSRNIDDERFINPSGTIASICENMKNLADFSICATFNDGKLYRINYLVSNDVPLVEELTYNLYDGFTYEFKFYI